MAISKFFIISLLVSLLFLHQIQALQTSEENTNPVQQDAYNNRKIGTMYSSGQLSPRAQLCKRANGTCSGSCGGVPGTPCHNHTCPCCASSTTHANSRKSP